MPPSSDRAQTAPGAVRAKTSRQLKKDREEAELRNRTYLKPVAWLLGKQLISSLKGTLLFTAYGGKLDARDWMRAEEFPFDTQEAARKFLADIAAAAASPAEARPAADDSPADLQHAAEEWWRRQAEGAAGRGSRPRPGEFWFDYISDTGDGMRATYSIAYLCISDLWADAKLADLQQNPFGPSRPGHAVGFVAAGDDPQRTFKYPNADLNRPAGGIDESKETELPRGQFLLVGGDATYHLSDYEGLHMRFQTPFKWAHTDVKRDGRLLKTGRRPLFGIPGNHDYYDQLDGFRRQFHHPVKEDEFLDEGAEGKLKSPQLAIPGFFRRQAASYISLRLPFGWLLWGLDTEVGKLDERQRKFFRSVKVKGRASVDDGARPDKLIVATSAPTTVFGKYADKDDEKSAKAFYQLGLPRPFLSQEDKDHEANLTDENGRPSPDRRDNELAAGQCRLDISGDIHQYARYWGRASGHDPREHKPGANGAGGATAEHPHPTPHYASVVSGLGGAFHHPTTTYAGEICEQVLYPPPEESRPAIANKIFCPWLILRGGGVGVIGFLLAFLIYYAATYAKSSTEAINGVEWLRFLGIAGGAAGSVAGEALGDAYVRGVRLAFVSFFSLLLSFVPLWFILRKYRLHEEVSSEHARPDDEDDDDDEGGGGLAQELALRSWTKWLAGLPAVFLDRFGDTSKQSSELWYKKLLWQYHLYAGPLLLLSAGSLILSLLTLEPYHKRISTFANSLLVLLTLIWAGSALFTNVRYSDWLTKMASKITLRLRDWLLVWLVTLVAAFGVVVGFAAFGRYNSASDMMTDILLTLVVAAVLLGLTGLGAFKFGEVKPLRSRVFYGALGLFLGFFHAVLQLLVPLLLVRKGSARTWLWAAVLLVAMQFAGLLLMRSRAYKLLPLAWLVSGAAMLALPYGTAASGERGGAVYAFVGRVLDPARPVFDNYFGITMGGGWDDIGVCIIAGLVGALSSCVWLSWYFATALAFDGHNNEAGGAARIERFKQFIRFRLTEKDLTGFVVAIDDPQKYGNKLRPRLVDVIHLTLKN